MEQSNENTGLKAIAAVLGIILLLALLLGLVFGVVALGKNFHRSQRLQDERNKVSINEIKIRQTGQLVKVEQQKAEVRIAEAEGISKSQAIIKSTLTPAYLQYLAISAQKDQINSPNHTIIYIPTGSNGVPLVTTVPQN